MLASSAGGPGFNPQSRTASYQRRYKNGTSSSLVWHWTLKGEILGSFSRIMIGKINVMDKIWDRKSFEVGDHWPLWRGWKKRMITQNRHKSNANKNKLKNPNLDIVFRCKYQLYKPVKPIIISTSTITCSSYSSSNVYNAYRACTKNTVVKYRYERIWFLLFNHNFHKLCRGLFFLQVYRPAVNRNQTLCNDHWQTMVSTGLC